MVGIDITVTGADAVGHDNPFEGIQDGPDDGGVSGAVIGGADQRLNDAPALNLMVILPDHGFLAADIQPGKHVLQRLTQICRFGKSGLFMPGQPPPGL